MRANKPPSTKQRLAANGVSRADGGGIAMLCIRGERTGDRVRAVEPKANAVAKISERILAGGGVAR